MNEAMGVIPVLTTQAGSCLTGQNWQEVGVKALALDLMALLMKPGAEVLKEIPHLGTYVGWDETLVLNASSLKMIEGRCTIRSHFDGRSFSYTYEEIGMLIADLKPSIAILPEGLKNAWPAWQEMLSEDIFPFLHEKEAIFYSDLSRVFGIYFKYDDLENDREQRHDYNCPIYIMGNISLTSMRKWVEKGAIGIESDSPAREAYSGNVYSNEGMISLFDQQYEKQFQPIDKNCRCPVCSQSFTKAYLHHLLAQTPLLCQRYLIQHNLIIAKVIWKSKVIHLPHLEIPISCHANIW